MPVKLKHYSKRKLKKEILEIIGKYLDLNKYQVFFFGSRVDNKGSERSDIDIGIEGPKEVPLGIMAKIRDEVSSLPTLYSIDIIDFRNVDKDFLKVAKQKTELLT